jgi:hypothetical protein
VDDRIIELLYRNLQEVFGEGDAARRRAAVEDFYTEDCVLYVPPGVFVGHDALDKFAGDLRATHPTSSIRLMESHKPCTTGGFWHGAQARKARPLTTPDWMSSLFAMARSLRSTSFSIPNLHSAARHPCGLPSRPKGVPNFGRRALLPRQVRQEGPFGRLVTIPRRQDFLFKPRDITVGYVRIGSIATGRGKLQVQPCPQCPVSDGRPEKGGLS